MTAQQPTTSQADSNSRAPFYFGIILAILAPAIMYVDALNTPSYTGGFFPREFALVFTSFAVLVVAVVLLVLSLLAGRLIPHKNLVWIVSWCKGLLVASSVLLVAIFIIARAKSL